MRVPLVIPAYNEELLIGTCLEHALAQTPSFDEIIVVDNDWDCPTPRSGC